MKSTLISLASCILVVLSLVASAHAGLIMDATIVTITASDAQGSAQHSWLIQPGTVVGDTYEWSLSEPTVLQDGGRVLGIVKELTLEYDSDPGVSLFNAVQAGSTDMTFTLTSAAVTFPTIINGLAYATAGMTVTDSNADGAYAIGQFDGGKSYHAMFNSGTGNFASLVSSVAVPPEESYTVSERVPGSGRITIPGSVFNIQGQFSFLLSAYDQAGVTSRFDIIPVPEPSSVVALLVAGGVGLVCVALRRRRCR